ncbi:MAG: FHA domain-containing protein [Cyanobacteria bacterium J06632_22]
MLTPQPSAAPTAASAASPAVTPPDALPQQGNGLWEALFENLDYNFDAVYTVIDAILTAKDRCQVTPLYIQGVVTPSATFLASNVGQSSRLQLTTVDTCWRMGRATDCALYIPHPAVDSCHAAIHYTAETGFRLTDLGSTTGLRHNRHRLPSLSRRHLRNGDLIELGTLRIEFFIDDFNTACTSDAESTTYF